jgi:4-diphosphocytidyl-2C-methyl-D-erythritol kinase
MRQTYIKSYAKINIALNVTGKRENGYHDLDMIMVPIELHDTIVIEKNYSPDNFVTIDEFSSGVIEHNVVTKVINILSEEYGLKEKLKVFIHKVVPMRAGLGGGSSNAGAVIVALNKKYNLGLDVEEMKKIAVRVGADVPFFIECKPSRVRGIGEILDPIKISKQYHVLIVKPKEGLTTADVFKKADEMTLETANIEDTILALETGDDELLEASISNALEKPAISLLPEIGEVISYLKEAGLKIVHMSGSGSSVFALTTDIKLLKKLEVLLEDKYIVEITKIKK